MGVDEKCRHNFSQNTTSVETNLKILRADWKVILKGVLNKQTMWLWNEFTWLRTGNSDGLL
jgi:hypothetical protein